jgi:hypothetical protein
VAIWYLFTRFGILCQEKSGNPDTVAVFKQVEEKNELAIKDRITYVRCIIVNHFSSGKLI